MFRGFDRSIWIRFSGVTLLSIGNFMIKPFLALYLATALGASIGVIGLVLTVRPLGGLLGSMLGGYYADKIGRKPVMIAGVALDALTLLGYAMTENVLWFALLSFFHGLFSSFAEPANSAMIADVTTEENRARAYSLIYTGVNIGSAIGPLLAVGVILHYPKILFSVMAALTLLYALVVLFLIPETKPENRACTSDACKKSQGKIGYGFVLQDRKLMFFLLGGLALALGYNQVDSYLALHIQDILSDLMWLYGVMMSVNGILCVLLAMPLTNFAARFNSYSVIKAGAAVYALGMLIVALNQNAWLMLAGFIVFTIGEVTVTAVRSKILADIAPDDMRARYQSAGSLSWTLAATSGPLLGGMIMGQFGGHALFVTFACVMASAVLFYRMMHVKKAMERQALAH